MGESANSCRKEETVVFSLLEWESAEQLLLNLFLWISWFVLTVNISVGWCVYQRIDCFCSPSCGVNTTKHFFSPYVVWVVLPNRLFLHPVVWMRLPHRWFSPLCGMNVSTKSQDVVWMYLPNLVVWYDCLPNLMVWYECVYQVLWCNSNKCISNVPCPSMTTRVRLKALYMKHYNTQFNNALHISLPLPLRCIHTCTPTHTISQPLASPPPPPIISQPIEVSSKMKSLVWYECVHQIMWCGMNVSTKSCGVVWMCPPNHVMWYECVHQIM